MKRTFGILFLVGWVFGYAQQTLNLEVSGKLIDEDTKHPIPHANVYIKETFIGTVANSDGEFAIIIPSDHRQGILVISSLGYETLERPIQDLSDGSELEFRLKSMAYLLQEVVIPNIDLVLMEALKKIPDNYPLDKRLFTTFYREVVKKNRSYVDISQGILNVTKMSYDPKAKGSDEITIYKGHRVKNYTGMDTLVFKLQGGPNTMMMLDVVNNPGEVLSADVLSLYRYSYGGIQLIDGRRSYILYFEPNGEANFPLYEGTIYIDEKTFGIAALSFGYGEYWLDEAGVSLVRQKPLLATLIPEKIWYDVRYRISDSKWYLDYVRNEIEMKVNWRRKLFNSRFSAVSELVVTNKKMLTDSPVDRRIKTQSRELFSETIDALQDTEYWEDYSIIQPEEDLKKAISKISRND